MFIPLKFCFALVVLLLHQTVVCQISIKYLKYNFYSQFYTYKMWIIIISGVVLLYMLLKSQKKRLFAYLLSNTSVIHNNKVRVQKLALFEQLATIESCDPLLRKTKEIRILELGAGTGANFEFYPKNCRLTIIEPNSFCEKFLRKNAAKYPGIKIEDYIVKPAESISRIDIKFGEFDVVVSTLVCCSVKNLPAVYKFITNALTPGGRFLFLEHILHPPPAKLHYIQRFLDFSGIWAAVFDGCHLSRSLEKSVLDFGFDPVKTTTFYIDHTLLSVWNFVKIHVYGTAFKPKNN